MTSRNYISASQLKSFAKCPKQYEYNYNSDLYPTKLGEGYRSFGREIHQVIEEVMSEYPDLRSRDKLEYKFLKKRDELDIDYPEEMNEDAKKCLRNAAKFISDRPDMNIRGVEVDHKFKIARPDLNQTFRAILDITTDTGIIDWKSGSSIRVEDEKIQGAVYLAAYTNLYDEMPEDIKFVYLKKGEMNTHSMDEEDDNDLWENMVSLSKQLMKAWEEDNWPARPGPSKCYWCGWEGYCPSSQVGMQGVGWYQYP